MNVHVLLTVDLNRGVSEDARNKFNEHLKSEQWKRLSLTTTWTARFKEGVSTEGAVTQARADVKRAAAAAGILYYEAAAEAGYSEPTVWNQST